MFRILSYQQILGGSAWPKVNYNTPFSLPFVSLSHLNWNNPLSTLGTMEEMKLLTRWSCCVRSGHCRLLDYHQISGESMSSPSLDPQPISLSTQVLWGLTEESWVSISLMEDISAMGLWPPQRRYLPHHCILSRSHTEFLQRQDWLTTTSFMRMRNSSFLIWLLQVWHRFLYSKNIA